MAVIALCSAKGAPGVTTTAIGLTLAWPRPALLLEADPTGGNGVMAGFFQGGVEYGGGLVEVAFSVEPAVNMLSAVMLPLSEPDLGLPSRAGFVAGPRSPAQARGVASEWKRLTPALRDLRRDVIVDAGPLGLPGSPGPLLAAADLTLLVLRSHLPGVAGARPVADLIRRDRLWAKPGLLVVGPGDPYTRREVRDVLGLPVIATVANDPANADVYFRGARRPGRFEGSPLVKSLRSAAQDLATHLGIEAPDTGPSGTDQPTGGNGTPSRQEVHP